MLKNFPRFCLVLAMYLLALSALSGSHKSTAQPADSFAIRGVRLFDGRQVTENRTVLISQGEILQIGGENLSLEGFQTIDASGHTLLPGLIDSHVHLPGFNTEIALSQSLALGVTTVIDMFSVGETLQALQEFRELDDPAHSSILMAGTGATATSGHPSQMMPSEFATIDRAEDAEQFVQARISEGSDFIKIIYDDLSQSGPPRPIIDIETFRALVESAHAQGLLAIAHIGTESQARDAINAGVDGLAHIFGSGQASNDFGTFARDHNIFVIPTLSVLHSVCGRPDGPQLMEDPRIEPFVAPQFRNLATVQMPATQDCEAIEPVMHQLIDANVPLLTGTDAAIPGTAYGASVHGELTAMVEYGMSPIQALAAATSVPASMFDMADRGLILPGKRADLILIDGDPTTNILDTRNIVTVWKAGVAVNRSEWSDN